MRIITNGLPKGKGPEFTLQTEGGNVRFKDFSRILLYNETSKFLLSKNIKNIRKIALTAIRMQLSMSHLLMLFKLVLLQKMT